MQATTLCRVDIWHSDHPELWELHPAMRRDISRLVLEGKVHENAYGSQTNAVLQNFRDDHWDQFFSLVHSQILGLLTDRSLQLDHGQLVFKSWASVISSTDTPQKIISQSLHSHSSALLSAVYFLDLGKNEETGTYFVNPLSMIYGSGAYGTIIPARDGRLILFNSGIVHAPLISLSGEQHGERVVIAIDAHYSPEVE